MYPNGVRLKEKETERSEWLVPGRIRIWQENTRTSLTVNCRVGSSQSLVPGATGLLCGVETHQKQKTCGVKILGRTSLYRIRPLRACMAR